MKHEAPCTSAREEVRNQQRAAIDKDREAALLVGVEWDGHVWHTDERFQLCLTARISAWQAGIIPALATQTVRTKANETVELSFEQHKQLALRVMLYVSGVWSDSWMDKDALP